MKKEDAAHRLLEAMTEIDDRYIEEAMPKEIVEVPKAADSLAHSHHKTHPSKETEPETRTTGTGEESSKVLYMKPKRNWQPIGIVAAAAVLVLGFGAYRTMEKSTTAPAMLSETAAQANARMAKAFSADSGVVSETPAKDASNGSWTESTQSAGDMARSGVDTYSVSNEESGLEAAGSEANGAMGMQIANPWNDFDQLADAEADAGFQMTIPESYAGFDHRLYRSMHGDMLEVIYQNEKDQEGFRIRKAHEQGDISGDYTNYTVEETQEIGGHTVQLRGNGADFFGATWSTGDYSYAICVAEDQHFTVDDMKNLIAAIDPS